MSNFTRATVMLASISLVVALMLSLLNSRTAPIIERLREEQILHTLDYLAPGGEYGMAEAVTNGDYPSVKSLWLITFGDGTEGLILSLNGVGFGGDMTILASYTKDGSIVRARLLDNAETPGIGKKAEEDSFMAMFFGSGSDQLVPVRSDMLSPEYADAVTGTTITFVGLAAALKEGSDYVKKEVNR